MIIINKGFADLNKKRFSLQKLQKKASKGLASS